jgi:hypothetical protein
MKVKQVHDNLFGCYQENLACGLLPMVNDFIKGKKKEF